MTDQPGALWIPNGNAFVGRNGLTPRYVILHGTAGGTSAQAIANYFASTQGGSNPVSANYVIGTDGTIVCCNPEEDGAWANGVFTTGHDSWWDTQINPNNITISIEHCKASTDNSDALTQPQQDASFQLIHDICQRWNIPMGAADGNGGVTGHFSIDPVYRSRCPGTYPWDELWTYLSNGGNNVISNSGTYGPNSGDFNQWFTVGSDGNWTCKQTGAVLMGGNKALYSQLSIDGNTLPVIGLPLESEQYQPDGTSTQNCERARIIYDSKKNNNQPGMSNSYLGFVNYNPPTITVHALPDAVIADIKQLTKDAGL